MSSPHSTKYFEDQNAPKMGRYDSDWIIILFFIHLNAFEVEKVEESYHGAVFIGGTQFGKMGPQTFEECFEASNYFFLG